MKAVARALALLALVLLVPSLRAQAPATPPGAVSLEDEASAREGELIHDVRADLPAERFDTLDQLARDFRDSRARWEGGGWKLRTLYEALDAPHQTEADMQAHLEHLRHWMEQRPDSLTARVALAASLTRWAWIARGNGTADKVTPEGWQLFGQRIAEAKTVLDGSAALPAGNGKGDPQWYAEQMTVGLAQGADAGQMQRLFDRATEAFPGYQYFYKERANYLLPKWYGQPGEATQFARTAADHVGGDLGDYLYFEIAKVILSRSNGGGVKQMMPDLDWPRIQRGYRTLENRWGTNRNARNELAYMAVRFGDRPVAMQQFASIGNEWSHSVWKDRNRFEKARDWANEHQNWP